MIFWKLSLTRVLWVSRFSCPVLLGVGTLRASLLNFLGGDLGVLATMLALCQWVEVQLPFGVAWARHGQQDNTMHSTYKQTMVATQL